MIGVVHPRIGLTVITGTIRSKTERGMQQRWPPRNAQVPNVWPEADRIASPRSDQKQLESDPKLVVCGETVEVQVHRLRRQELPKESSHTSRCDVRARV